MAEEEFKMAEEPKYTEIPVDELNNTLLGWENAYY